VSLVQKYLEPLLIEINNSYRLRIGFYVILALLLIWAVLVLSDERSIREQDYWLMRQNQLEFANLEAVDVWQQRIVEEQSRHQELMQGVWVGKSESQLIAAIQTATREMMRSAGLQNYSVELGTPQVFDEERQLRKIRLRIRAEFDENAALAFVAAVENSRPNLVFEKLSIDVIELKRRKSRLRADIVAFLKEGSQ
jgi:hypothetical protein